jgi:hypothetical protein
VTGLLNDVLAGFRRVVRRTRMRRHEARATALPIDGRRPADVRRENLEIVVGLLTAAGIPCGALPSSAHTQTAVAVSGADRARLIAALTGAPVDESVRAQILEPGNLHLSTSLQVAASRLGSMRGPLPPVRVFRLRRDAASDLQYGETYGCVVESWQKHPEHAGWHVAPRSNPLASALPAEEFVSETVEWMGAQVPVVAAARRHVTPTDITFPVDIVYLWVDGDDPEWRARMHHHRGTTDTVGASEERFRQIEELRYSLRSLDMYAPWARRVYVVTDRQWPSWLVEDERLVRVDHSQIADRPDRLPVYNSDVIVSWLAGIEGLSEQFLYMNDDFFFGRDVTPALFFTPTGQLRVFPSNNQRPLGPVVDGEPMQESRVKQMTAAIEERFGRRPVDIIRHTPYPMSKAAMQRVEESMSDLVDRTRQHRFREIDDIPIEQAVHYVAEITGNAVRSPIRYGYMNITSAVGMAQLGELVHLRDRDVFCLNDAPEKPGDVIDVPRVRAALERMFPIPSRWER